MREAIPLRQARTAIYQRLKADLAPVPVYPLAAPQDSEFPYAVLTHFSVLNPTTKEDQTSRVTATIEVYSNYEGSDQVMQIQNSIWASITREALSFPDGYEEVYGMGNLELAEHFAQWDGSKVIILGVVKYSFSMQEV